MIFQILSHWEKTLKEASEKQTNILRGRIEEVQAKQTCMVYQDSNKTIFLGKSDEHTQRICQVWIDCDCNAFLCSGKGHENKTPCKHLYALALWVQKQKQT